MSSRGGPAGFRSPDEAPVNLDQGAFLLGRQASVQLDRPLDVGRVRRCRAIEQADLVEQAFGGNLQAVGDRLQDFGRRLVNAALDLREVRVGHLGDLRQLAQRQVCEPALRADELTERLPRVFLGHVAEPTTRLACQASQRALPRKRSAKPAYAVAAFFRSSVEACIDAASTSMSGSESQSLVIPNPITPDKLVTAIDSAHV